MYMPRISGDWWPVARNPDLGDLNGPPREHSNWQQQPVDFAAWQAGDGTWQLWSCIRSTNCGGKTRLFHRWESQRPFDTNWKADGIAMQADPAFGETPGGLQAPHVVRDGNTWYMAYGDWEHICIQRSRDGKHFERWPGTEGKTGLFSEGPGANTRDAMLIRIGDRWHCYYTAHPGSVGAVYCRTSKDLRAWSNSKIVARGGIAGTGLSSSECPHVVRIGEYYYLFRTQRYADPPTTSVYRSDDPMDFGVDAAADRKLVCLLEVAAPEVVYNDGSYLIAALAPDLQGIRIARLSWVLDLEQQRRSSLVWHPSAYQGHLFYEDLRGYSPAPKQ